MSSDNSRLTKTTLSINDSITDTIIRISNDPRIDNSVILTLCDSRLFDPITIYKLDASGMTLNSLEAFNVSMSNLMHDQTCSMFDLAKSYVNDFADEMLKKSIAKTLVPTDLEKFMEMMLVFNDDLRTLSHMCINDTNKHNMIAVYSISEHEELEEVD